VKNFELVGVRFNCLTGKPSVVVCGVTLEKSILLGPWIRVHGGVTGHESFCLGGKSAADLKSMTTFGWHACAGTPGRWDALFFHGLQMAKLFKDMGIDDD